MKFRMKKFFLFFLLAVTAVFAASASGVMCTREFYPDVEKITGSLDDTGQQLAYFSLVSSADKMGIPVKDREKAAAICSKMTNTQYNYAVEKAADLAMNKAARTALEAGKLGEKVLKSIINSTSKAIEDTKDWAQQQ